MGSVPLLCVETNKQSHTDAVYIDETIAHYYLPLGSSIKKAYIFLDGKGNYNKTGILNEIDRRKKQYKPNGPTYVVYCVDTDKYDSIPEHAAELQKIAQFCNANDFDMIWFSRDVEDVYWGMQVRKDEKTRMAAQFRSSGRINEVGERQLVTSSYSRHHSSILEVLDKYLVRKS